jgi:hypothetical protein
VLPKDAERLIGFDGGIPRCIVPSGNPRAGSVLVETNDTLFAAGAVCLAFITALGVVVTDMFVRRRRSELIRQLIYELDLSLDDQFTGGLMRNIGPRTVTLSYILSVLIFGMISAVGLYYVLFPSESAPFLQHNLFLLSARCLIPGFDGAFLSSEWRDALWARFSMGAPQRQRQSVEQYKIVRRA